MKKIPKPHPFPYTENPCLRVTVVTTDGPAQVMLSAYEDFGRLTRVRNAALRLPLAILKKLRRLHDHKGDLGVVWNTLPTGNDIAAIVRVWEAESEYSTSHFFDEEPLLGNIAGRPPSDIETVISGTPLDAKACRFLCPDHRKS